MIKNFFNWGNEDKKDQSDKLREIGTYLSLGLQLAVTIAVMAFLGIWLDKKFETNPWLTIIFSFLGIFAALYSFLKTVLKSK